MTRTRWFPVTTLTAALLAWVGNAAAAEPPAWILGTWEAEQRGARVRLVLGPAGSFEMTMSEGGESRDYAGTYHFEGDQLGLMARAGSAAAARDPAPGPDLRPKVHQVTHRPGSRSMKLGGGYFGMAILELEKVEDVDPRGQPRTGGTPLPEPLLGRWGWSSGGDSLTLVLEAGGTMHMVMTSDDERRQAEVRHRDGQLVIRPRSPFQDPRHVPYTLEGDTLEVTLPDAGLLPGTEFTLTRIE